MLMAHGFLRRLFEVFERFKTPVDVVTTSEVSVSVTVDNTRRLDDIVEQPARASPRSTSSRDMAIVCVVGENLHDRSHAVRARGDRARGDSAAAGVAGGVAPEHHVRAAGRGRAAAMNRLHEAFFAVSSESRG